jgi:hypothetical protein
MKKQNRRGLSSQLHRIPEEELASSSCAYVDTARPRRKYRRSNSGKGAGVSPESDGNKTGERLRSQSPGVENERLAGGKLRTG